MKKILLLIITIFISSVNNVHASIDDLYNAIKADDVALVTALISQVNVNEKKANGQTSALWLAVYYNSTEIVTLLLDAGADVTAEEDASLMKDRISPCYQGLPLEIAIKYGNLNIVKLLVKKGAKINLENEQGHFLFFHALTPAKQQEVRKDNASSIVATPTDQDKQAIAQYLIEQGADIRKKNSRNNDTLLHYAAFFRHLDIVKSLIKKGAQVNAKNDSDETPLHSAVMQEIQPNEKDKLTAQKNIVEFLLNHGAKQIKNCQGELPKDIMATHNQSWELLDTNNKKQNRQYLTHATSSILGLGLLFADWYSYKFKKSKKTDTNIDTIKNSQMTDVSSKSSQQNPDIKKERKKEKTWLRQRFDTALVPFIDMYKHPKEHKKALVGAAITVLSQIYWYLKIKP